MVNKVILIGNIGNDPEIKRFDNNGKMAKLSLATNKFYKDKNGERQTKVTWHNVVVFGASVDFIERYCGKGDKMYVEGSIENRSWDGQDGQKHYITEIVCTQVQKMSNKSEGKEEPSEAVKAERDLAKDDEEDDLPF